jgi:hypothetical protein
LFSKTESGHTESAFYFLQVIRCLFFKLKLQRRLTLVWIKAVSFMHK